MPPRGGGSEEPSRRWRGVSPQDALSPLCGDCPSKAKPSNPFHQLRSIRAVAAHRCAHLVKCEKLIRRGFHQHRCALPFFAEPQAVILRRNDHRHPVMDRRQHLVRGACHNRTGVDDFAVRLSPRLPYPGKSKIARFGGCDEVRCLRFLRPLPFIESARGDQASTLTRGIAE